MLNNLVYRGLKTNSELEAKGQKYTYMNIREDETFVMEKLDKAFATVDWINTYPQYTLHNHLS